jgi:hypothetical protein
MNLRVPLKAADHLSAAQEGLRLEREADELRSPRCDALSQSKLSSWLSVHLLSLSPRHRKLDWDVVSRTEM